MEKRIRMQLGLCLGDYFSGGGGPLSHDGLSRLNLGLDIAEPEDVGSKRDRVRWIIDNEEDEAKLWTFVESLVDALREGHYFDQSAQWCQENTLRALRRTLTRSGRGLSGDGYLTGQALPLPTTTLDEDEVFQSHLSRLRVAAERDDSEQVVGTAMDLLEGVVKRVLENLDMAPGRNAKLPDLARRAQKALKLHADKFGPDAIGGALTVRNSGRLIDNRLNHPRIPQPLWDRSWTRT